MKRFFIAVLLLLTPFHLEAACTWTGNVGTAASAGRDDLYSCLSVAPSHLTGGAVIIEIPPDTAVWTTGITIDMGSAGWASVTSLTIQGAGKALTTISDKLPSHGWKTAALFIGGVKSGVSVRVTGIGFIAGADTISTLTYGILAIDGYSTTNYSKTVRVDNCDILFSGNYGGKGIFVSGVYGLIDNNTFRLTTNKSIQGVTVTGTPLSHGETIQGTVQWANPLKYNSDEAVYIENNTFTYSYISDGAFDSNSGSRVVFRYNTVTGTNAGHHGLDSGGRHSARQFEIYNNAFTGTTARGYNIRGGTGVLYNNTFSSGFTMTIELNYYRSCCDCSGTGCITGIGNCSNGIVPGDGTTYATITDYPEAPTYITNLNCTTEGVLSSTHGWGRCNGTNALDGNADATGYPCAEAPGMSGANGTTSDPIYMWNNTKNGTLSNGGVGTTFTCSSPSINDHIKADRDYIDNGTTAKPGYTAYTCPHPLTGLAEGCATTGETMYGTTGYNTGEDTTAPTCTFAIDATGLIATGTCSESVDAVTKTGLSFTGSVTGAITATYKDGMPGANPRFDLGSEVQQSDVVTADYTTPGTGIKDAAGNALANFTGASVFNGSTQNTPPTYSVTINKTGTGCTITSSPSGANCGSTCSVTVDNGTVVTLGGYLENGWASITYGGDCASNGTVTVNAAKTCTVTCTPIYLLN